MRPLRGQHISHDFDLRLIFDLNIWVNAKFGGYIFYTSRKSEFYLLLIVLVEGVRAGVLN